MGRDCHIFRSHCLIKVEPNMIGADLGAGNARWARVLADRGALMTAVDVLPAPDDLREGVEWVQMRIEDWIKQIDPFVRFDFIMSFNLIHFLDREYVLEHLLPCLAAHVHPGGWMAIRTFCKHPEPVTGMEDRILSLYKPTDILGALPRWRTHRAHTDQDLSEGQCGTTRLWHITDVLAIRPE